MSCQLEILSLNSIFRNTPHGNGQKVYHKFKPQAYSDLGLLHQLHPSSAYLSFTSLSFQHIPLGTNSNALFWFNLLRCYETVHRSIRSSLAHHERSSTFCFPKRCIELFLGTRRQLLKLKTNTVSYHISADQVDIANTYTSSWHRTTCFNNIHQRCFWPPGKYKSIWYTNIGLQFARCLIFYANHCCLVLGRYHRLSLSELELTFSFDKGGESQTYILCGHDNQNNDQKMTKKLNK